MGIGVVRRRKAVFLFEFVSSSFLKVVEVQWYAHVMRWVSWKNVCGSLSRMPTEKSAK
jgi:hypothetical protein